MARSAWIHSLIMILCVTGVWTTTRSQTSLITNGNFESGTTGWTYTNASTGTFQAVAPGYLSPNAGRVAVTRTGSTMLLYRSGFALTAGTRYRVTFAGYSSSARDVAVNVQKNSASTSLGLAATRMNLTTGWVMFSVEFVASGFTGTTTDTRLRFNFASYARAGDSYYLDSVAITPVVTTTPPSIATQPQTQSVSAGQAATFSVTASGTAPLTYQWMKDGLPITGATASSHTTPATTAADSGAQFTVVVTNSFGSVTSAPALLLVSSSPPAITVQPADRTVADGAAASFSVTATGPGTLTYQWQRNGAAIAGATSSSFAIAAATMADSGAAFRAIVANGNGSTPSMAAVLTVIPSAPTITTQPVAASISPGTTATFTVAAAGTTPLSYQWQKNGSPIAGATASSYTTPAVTAADNGATFRCIVANRAGSVTSNAAALTVATGVVVSDDFNATTLDAARWHTALPGTPSTVTTTGTGTSNAYLSIQIPAGSAHDAWEGTNGAVRVLQTLNNADMSLEAKFESNLSLQYQFQGIIVEQDASNYVRFDFVCEGAVLRVFAASVIGGTPTVHYDAAVTKTVPMYLRVTRSGNQWTQQWSSNGTTWTQTVSFSQALTATGAGILAGNAGSTPPATTILVDYFFNRNAPITAEDAGTAPVITAGPSDVAVNAGQVATFSLTAGGTAPLTYQWSKNGTPISGATGASYTTPAVTVGDNGSLYRCTVTNGAGSVLSAAATLTVNAPPAVTVHPSSLAVPADAAARFTVGATGSRPFSYQWMRDGAPIGPATDSLYVIASAAATDSGAAFVCIVTNGLGSDTSDAAVLSVGRTPLITVDPAPLTIAIGTAATFSIAADGSLPLAFQWKRNGTSIPGATGASYTLAAAQASDDSTRFEAFVTNAYGADTSAPALLRVQAPAVFTAEPRDTTTAEGSAVSFAVTAAGTLPLTYAWERNGATVPGATTRTLSLTGVSLTDDSSWYRCIVANTLGSDTSRNAILRVTLRPPAIVREPASTGAQTGQTATFTVRATGSTPLTYQWQKNGLDIAGANDTLYITPAITLADNGAGFRCIVSNSAGKDTSATAVLSVGGVPPSVTADPAHQTVPLGRTYIFTASATGSGTISYQWQKNNNPIAGATGQSYIGPATISADNGAGFRCIVSSQYGRDTSAAAVLTVTSAPPWGIQWTMLSSSAGTMPPPKATGTEHTASLVLDINKDGWNDFVIADRTTAPSVVWYQRTYAGWTVDTIDSTLLPIEAGGTFFDIDGDGDHDIVFGGDYQSDEVWWWENPHPSFTGTWTRRLIKNSGGTQHHDMIFADVDGDGRTEFVYWNQLPRPGGDKLFLAEIPAAPKTTQPWPATQILSGRLYSEGLDTADVDGDGKLDLVSGGSWYKHTGGTSFVANIIDSTVYYGRVAVGQLIPGGRPEIVLCNGDTLGPLRWYEWNGTIWNPHDLLGFSAENPHSLAIADIDRDGSLDIFSAEMMTLNNNDAKTRVFCGDGTGMFQLRELASGIDNHESRVADLDGDGDLDILSKPYDTGVPGVRAWIANGTGTRYLPLNLWRRRVIDGSIPAIALFVLPGDMDRDGYMDIVAGGWWYKNPRDIGLTWQRNTIGSPLNSMFLLHDLDGDGDTDILGTQGVGDAANDSFAWAQNNGSGGFTVRTNIQQGDGMFPQGASAARFQAGGPLEVALDWDAGVTGVHMISVPTQPETETWTWRQISTVTLGEGIDNGDIDGDGDLDMLLGTTWLRNDGGIWTPFVLHVPATGEPDRNYLVDMDRDGDLDAVIGYGHDTAGKLAWYEHPANPTALWAEHIIGNVVGPHSVSVRDFDRDGDLDVVMGEHNNPALGSERLIMFRNADGAGTTWEQILIATGDEHHDGAIATDIDGDGDLDVISVGYTHGRVLLYENLAIDTIVVAIPPTITGHPSAVSAAVGQTATFSIVATGTGTLSYQWQRNGGTISGATGATYTTPVLAKTDSGAVFRCVVTNTAGTATSNAATLSVTSGGIVSDDFRAATLNTALWTVVNPAPVSTFTLTGTGTVNARLAVAIPAGSAHDAWDSGNFTPRILQPTTNTDFEVEAKFESSLASQYQFQGIVVQQDATNYVRFDFVRDASSTRFFSASFIADAPTVRRDVAITNANPLYLRVKRAGNQWTGSYSSNGTTWTTGVTFSHTLVASSLGPFFGNQGNTPSASPAFTGYIDYFFNTAARISPEDPVVGKEAVQAEPTVPGATYLDNNYPNPFNPETRIRIGLAADGPVSVVIYNSLGEQVTLLQEGWMAAGHHELVFDGAGLPSGVYFCRMHANGFTGTRKLALVR